MYFYFVKRAIFVWNFRHIFEKKLTDEKYHLGEFTFSGQTLSGKFNGMGEIKFIDGSTYKGNFKNGCFD